MNLSIIKKKSAFIFNKYYLVVVILIVVIILGAGYLLSVQEVISDIRDIGVVDLESRKSQLERKTKTLEDLAKLKEDYSQVTDDQVRQLSHFLPEQSEIPYLIIEIKNFVRDNELILESISSGPLGVVSESRLEETIQESTLSRLNITLSIGGIDSYYKIKDFLDNLTKNLPILELTSLSYSPAVDTYSMNLTTFYK